MDATAQALENARSAGIDVDLLDSNLALTYEERVLHNQSALALVRALKGGEPTTHELSLLLQRLADTDLEFVIVGGFAGVLHGSAYVTDALDICTVITPENMGKLRGAPADLDPVHRSSPYDPSFLKHRLENTEANFSMETEAGIVDVLESVAGVGDYHAVKKNALDIPWFGRRVAVISLDDLIKAKEAVGREKDLLVAKELRAIAAKRKG